MEETTQKIKEQTAQQARQKSKIKQNSLLIYLDFDVFWWALECSLVVGRY